MLKTYETNPSQLINTTMALVFVVEAVFFLAGFSVFPGGIYVAQQYGLFANPCPVFHGRVCNDQGTCQLDSTCACNPLYSDHDCSKTQCPGYVPYSGQVCSGVGFCFPFIDVPKPCQGAWDSAACASLMATHRVQITQLGLPAAYNISVQTPYCVSNPPYDGLLSGSNTCPLGVSDNICSGNGNTSVGFIDIRTTTGQGCQCPYTFNLLEDLSVYSLAGVEAISTQYFANFVPNYCGKVYFDPARPNLLAFDQTQPSTCYCDLW